MSNMLSKLQLQFLAAKYTVAADQWAHATAAEVYQY